MVIFPEKMLRSAEILFHKVIVAIGKNTCVCVRTDVHQDDCKRTFLSACVAFGLCTKIMSPKGLDPSTFVPRVWAQNIQAADPCRLSDSSMELSIRCIGNRLKQK